MATGPHHDGIPPLQTSLATLLDEAQRLRGDVHTAEAARKRANQINLAVLGLLGLFVAMLLVIGWQNNQLAQDVSRTNEQVADCTTPGGGCYEDGRARTAGAIAALTRISVFVSQCGRLYPGESGPDFDRKLEQCVAAKLAQAQPSPSASTPR